MSRYLRKTEAALARWEAAEREVSPADWREAMSRQIPPAPTPEDRRTQATATLIAGCVAIVFWPAGLAAIVFGVEAVRHRGKPRPLGYNRAVAGLTMGVMATAIMTAAIIFHAIHPLTAL